MSSADTIFRSACDLRGDELAAYLDRACGGDDTLRAEVEDLLAADREIENLDGSYLSELVETAAAATRPEQIGPYRILGVIGEGGMGTVYAAEQVEPVRRLVALKVIKPGLGTREVIARFELERQALALMDHPGIARVLDAGSTDSGHPYFVMERVHGLRMTEYCDSRRATLTERLKLFVNVSRAIQHAHQKGIIHRDVKPSNILVTLEDGKPVPKVIDFGVAKAIGQRLTDETLHTRFRQLMGTPLYMSPEQASCQNLDVDTRSDVYSLGVLLYELVTGTLPFSETLNHADSVEIRRVILEEEPPKPSSRLGRHSTSTTSAALLRRTEPRKLRQHVRGDLDWIVMKALEKEPARRYATANALAADVERYLRHEPVVACPPTRMYLARKFARRYRAALTTAVVVLVLLVAGTAASTWQAWRASVAESEAVGLYGKEQEARALAERRGEELRRNLYVSDMNLVERALAVDDYHYAREILERQVPAEGQEDLRDWEWRWAWQFTGNNYLFTMLATPVSRRGAAFAHGGTPLVVGEEFRRLLILDLSSRTIAAATEVDQFTCFAISAQDTIALGGRDGTIRLRELRGITGSTPRPGFDSDLVTGASGFDSGLQELAFSPDGSWLACLGEGFLEIWDVERRLRVRRLEVACCSHWVPGVVKFSPDGSLLACGEARAGSGSETASRIRLFDVPSFMERGTLVMGSGELVTGVAISPDGALLASATGWGEGSLRLWSLESYRELARLDGHTAWVSDVAFLDDGRRLVSASADRTIRFWNVSDPRRPVEAGQIRSGDDELHYLAIAPDESTLASVSRSGQIAIWPSREPTRRWSVKRMPVRVRSDWGHHVRFLGDRNELVAIRHGDGAVVRWDLEGDDPPRPIPGLGVEANSVGVSRDGSRVFAMDGAGRFRCADPSDPDSVDEALATPGSEILTVFGDDDRVLTVLRRTSVTVWSSRPLEPLRTVATGEGTGYWSAFCPATGTLAGGLRDGRVLLQSLDVPAARTWLERGHVTGPKSAFAPGGELLATGGADGRLVFWEGRGIWTRHAVRGSRLGVHALAFSPSGRRLATAGDGQLRLRDTRTRRVVATLHVSAERPSGIVFSPGGNLIAYRADDGELVVFRAPSQEEIEAECRPGS